MLHLHFRPFISLTLHQPDLLYDIYIKSTSATENLHEKELCLFTDNIFAVFSSNHLLAQARTFHFEDLGSYTLIIPNDSDVGNYIDINLILSLSIAKSQQTINIPADQVPKMIAEGDGYTFCNRIIAEKIQDYGLVCVPVCFSGIPVHYQMRLIYKTPVSDCALALMRALRRNFTFPEDRTEDL